MILYCTGEYDELVGVDMDGIEVDRSNYTVTEGSTIVEFKPEYLETLSAGTNIVSLRYTNNRSVDINITATTLTNVDTSDSQDEEDINNDTGSQNVENTDNTIVAAGQVVTSDNNNVLVLIMMLIMAYGGIVVTGIIRRKIK